LYLTVWLRRQEAEVLRTRLLAQGFVDLSEEGAGNTAKVFMKYAAAMMPYSDKQQEATDAKMKEAMAKEVSKGVIYFNAPTPNPLHQRAKEMSLPDEFRRKLANRRTRT
jgi:hypothetical protein